MLDRSRRLWSNAFAPRIQTTARTYNEINSHEDLLNDWLFYGKRIRSDIKAILLQRRQECSADILPRCLMFYLLEKEKTCCRVWFMAIYVPSKSVIYAQLDTGCATRGISTCSAPGRSHRVISLSVNMLNWMQIDCLFIDRFQHSQHWNCKFGVDLRHADEGVDQEQKHSWYLSIFSSCFIWMKVACNKWYCLEYFDDTHRKIVMISCLNGPNMLHPDSSVTKPAMQVHSQSPDETMASDWWHHWWLQNVELTHDISIVLWTTYERTIYRNPLYFILSVLDGSVSCWIRLTNGRNQVNFDTISSLCWWLVNLKKLIHSPAFVYLFNWQMSAVIRRRQFR